MAGEGRSLAETPTWSVATVTTVLVAICFMVERSIHRIGGWLVKTKRKPLLAALEKIKQELMLLGLISLILSLSSRGISDICVKSSLYSSLFYPCSKKDYESDEKHLNHSSVSRVYTPQYHLHVADQQQPVVSNPCNKGQEPFVSYESLEQLHRLLFVLGVTHVLYCCLTMLLAMIKIYSWKPWEMEAHSKLITNRPDGMRRNVVFRRQSTFVLSHASHPWIKNRVLIWVICFLRQFFRSVMKGDYTALRLAFITNHRLRLTYDFHSYMVRTMEDEFKEIVGISWELWGYAIICMFFNLHGLNFYFWISWIPAILILLLGTKLQHVMARLAMENVVDPVAGTQLKPHDALFWFDKPQLLLWFIHFISFQNAFEMASFIWSWWEIKAHTCFMKDHAFVYTRLISGLLVQFWCSHGILPLYAIVTQMGSRYKKALVTEEIRESLHGWRKRVREKAKRDSSQPSLTTTKSSMSSEPVDVDKDEIGNRLEAECLSVSLSNITKRSNSLQRELSTTPLAQDFEDKTTTHLIQQEETLGSRVSVYSFRSLEYVVPVEPDSMDDMDDDDDSTDEENGEVEEPVVEPSEAP